MKIQLANPGPSMWFLGEPGNIKITLNFVNPGPIDIDFNDLEPEEQKYILSSIQQGKIETDESYEHLHKTWISSKPAVTEAPESPPQSVQQEQVSQQVEKDVGAYARAEKRERRFKDRLAATHKQSVKALRSLIAQESDVRFLRELLVLEKAKKKPRKSVLDYVTERLDAIQGKVLKEVGNRDVEFQKDPKTIAYDVIESEEEEFTFTQEELQEWALRDPDNILVQDGE